MQKDDRITTKTNEGRKRFDDVILEAGGFGRYQIIFMSTILITMAMAGSHIMATVFGFATPKFRCASPYPRENVEYYNVSFSPNYKGAYCNDCRFQANCSDSATGVRSRGTEGKKCSSWTYDTADYTSTIVSEFNFVCERKVLGSHAKMVFFAGFLIGSVVFGFVSDEFGRRTALTLSVTLVASSGIGISFAQSYGVLVAMFLFNGMAVVGLFIAGFMLAMELMTPDKRVRPGMLYSLGMIIGSMCSVPLAYWLRSWRNLQLAISAPCFAFLILFACIDKSSEKFWSYVNKSCDFKTVYSVFELIARWLPESGRWLLSKGRVERAEKEVFKMARFNGVKLPNGFNLRDVAMDKKERGDWSSVIKSRTLCKNMAIICLNWFSVGLAFYGITLNSVYLSGNRFINTFAMSAVGVPGLAILYVVLDRVGRKRVHCIVMILGGIAIIGSSIPIFVRGDSLRVMTTVLMILGRCCMSLAFSIVYYMTTEMFPTYARGNVMGFASTCSRLAAMIAPYVNDLGVTIDETYGKAFPPIVYGFLTTVSGLLTLCLPSTDKQPLPESVHDGETLGICNVGYTSGDPVHDEAE